MRENQMTMTQLAEFHKRQLDGEDYQQAAYDLGLFDPDGDWVEQSEPSPNCKCSTCTKTEFE